ncbi:hypothetical protein K435DRAFT_678950, partial [Dendrothele bispora CBS 962.96]
LLSKYFLTHELEPFYRMQEDCGVVVSGSTVLQFFTGCRWESDLDLYVLIPALWSAGSFLSSCGYDYDPTLGQITNFIKASNTILMSPPALDHHTSYPGSGIASVFNFKKGNRKIQLIACRSNILQVILGFHSTCVMNFVTRHHAVSLFPRSTLHSRTSLVNAIDPNPTLANALAKYADRGWQMLSHPPLQDYLSPESELGQVIRYPGDQFCYIRPLTRYRSLFPFEELNPDIATSSWNVSIVGETRSAISFELGRVSEFKSHCIATPIMEARLFETIGLVFTTS